VLRFYGFIYAIGLGVYLFFRYCEPVKGHLSRGLRQVAMFYWRWSRLAPLVACCFLFVLADLLAQLARPAATDGVGLMRWEIALILASALFNATWHTWFYSWLDRQVEEGEDLTGKLKETALKTLLHSVIYLPLTVPVFFIVVNWITRSLKDSVVNCSTSMVVGIPYNIGESTELASKQLASSFSGSFILWPGSSLINFTFIQQWSPGFKSTFDGIVMVLWNSYILAAQGAGDAAGPVAVGPALADRAELTADLKVDASVDCSRFSACAIARWIVESIWSAIYWSALYLFYFLQWCFFTTKTGLYLTGCFIQRKTWETWCVFCFCCRWIFMGVCKLMSFSCTVTYYILIIPFKMIEAIKYFIGLWFLPRFWDYDTCPCWKAEFGSNWTAPGVIYDGSFLFAPTGGATSAVNATDVTTTTGTTTTVA